MVISESGNTVNISLAHFFTFLIAIRIYLFFKLLKHYTLWTNQRAKRISNLLGFESDSKFACRVLLKTQPFFILSSISIIFILLIGTLLKEFEYYDASNSNLDEFRYIWNSYWLSIITMSTSNI